MTSITIIAFNYTMACGTQQITLIYFFSDSLCRKSINDHSCNNIILRVWITMMEIHRTRRECILASSAGIRFCLLYVATINLPLSIAAFRKCLFIFLIIALVMKFALIGSWCRH